VQAVSREGGGGVVGWREGTRKKSVLRCLLKEELLQILSGILFYTVSEKNVPPLVCYNFDTRERILILFRTNVIDKVGNQKTLYCVTSNNVCFCTTWQNGKTRKSHFWLKCCISALPEFNESLLDFFSLFDSVSYSRCCMTPKSCSQFVQLWLLRAWFKRKQQLDCVACTIHVHQCAVFWKKKNVICAVFDSVWHLLR